MASRLCSLVNAFSTKTTDGLLARDTVIPSILPGYSAFHLTCAGIVPKTLFLGPRPTSQAIPTAFRKTKMACEIVIVQYITYPTVHATLQQVFNYTSVSPSCTKSIWLHIERVHNRKRACMQNVALNRLPHPHVPDIARTDPDARAIPWYSVGDPRYQTRCGPISKLDYSTTKTLMKISRRDCSNAVLFGTGTLKKSVQTGSHVTYKYSGVDSHPR